MADDFLPRLTAALTASLTAALTDQGYREVPDASRTIDGGILPLKRQTRNTNRAVVVVDLAEAPTPADFAHT